MITVLTSQRSEFVSWDGKLRASLVAGKYISRVAPDLSFVSFSSASIVRWLELFRCFVRFIAAQLRV
jgi:hypothetical protein